MVNALATAAGPVLELEEIPSTLALISSDPRVAGEAPMTIVVRVVVPCTQAIRPKSKTRKANISFRQPFVFDCGSIGTSLS